MCDAHCTFALRDHVLLSFLLQYDQRELQALRQKSLLLSSKRDGCLYVFLKKFLLRVSLRGTVSVVADLLQLALAAAGRLCPDNPVGLSSSGGNFGAASQPQPTGSQDGDARSSAASPVFRVNSLSPVFKSLGCEDDGNACWASPPVCRSPSQSTELDESAVSRIIKRQVLQTFRQAQKRLHFINDGVRAPGGSNERLQEFLTCRGEGWEVNNCSIDGEGHCFYTVTHEKALSPLQQRGNLLELQSVPIDRSGAPLFAEVAATRLFSVTFAGHCMIFCIDTQGAVPRSRVLRFGRGVSEDAVLSLSLSAHPVIGCFLVVVKSASAVYGNVLSAASASSSSAGTDSSKESFEGFNESEDFADARALEKPWGNVTTEEVHRATSSNSECSESFETSDEPNIGAVVTSNEPLSTSSRYVEAMGNQPEIFHGPQRTSVRPAEAEPVADEDAVHEQTSGESQPTPTPRRENSGVQAVETASVLGSLGDRQATAARRANTQTQMGEFAEGTKKETLADEHSMWWFCPCQQDPTFYFPVAEWLHDEAIHNAAQSICRQFRGSPSTSVCRAYFGEDCSVAVGEAIAASNAAHAAAALVASAADAEVRREIEGSLPLRLLPSSRTSGSGSYQANHAVHVAASRALQRAATAAARAESAPSSGYILWQPGVKVRRPKTGEQVIDFGSALIIRARTVGGSEPTRTSHAVGPYSQPGRRSLGCITGETVAVISQDARHLEVRDALPSPLGFIVIPAEAANRIVKQPSEGSPVRLGSRNPVSLTSFLASFVMRSPPAVQNRGEGAGVYSSAGGTGSDDGRQAPTDGPGVSTEFVAGGAPAQTPESSHQRAIPAVNVVFLVDTLRLCRFAVASVASSASQSSGPKRGLCEGPLLDKWEDSQLDSPAESTTRVAAWPVAEKRECSRKFEHGTNQLPGSIEDSLTNGSKPESAPEPGERCSCKTGNFCSSGDPRAPALHPHFADVLLLCADGVEIPSHRALLAARCSFFEARLTRTHWRAQGNDKVVIDLRDFPGSVVKRTVQFFETGFFVIPATCCCHSCCPEIRRKRVNQQKVTSPRERPPHEQACCCRINWVLHAHTFAAYCLLHDLHAELLSVLARLISQRTCLHVLTHPAVRGQQQILQLAAHQLVYHMPMPNLLLETDDICTKNSGEKPVEDSSPKTVTDSPPLALAEDLRQRELTPDSLLPLLLCDGIYECVVTALCAWVLAPLLSLQASSLALLACVRKCVTQDTRQNALFFSKLQLIRSASATASELLARQLLVLLALRLLQESVAVPSSHVSECADFQYHSSGLCGKNAAFVWNSDPGSPKRDAVHLSSLRSEKVWLLVPLRDAQDSLQYFKFRDVVLLWARLLKVPEQDAKCVAQETEDLGPP
ncbi:hypothetical protein Esti_005660 [Eimeria stiedai]